MRPLTEDQAESRAVGAVAERFERERYEDVVLAGKVKRC